MITDEFTIEEASVRWGRKIRTRDVLHYKGEPLYVIGPAKVKLIRQMLEGNPIVGRENKADNQCLKVHISVIRRIFLDLKIPWTIQNQKRRGEKGEYVLAKVSDASPSAKRP